MKTIGVFKIKESFKITNRGIVAVGYFIEGMPRIGSMATVEVASQQALVKITGIERGNFDEEGNLLHGLLLSFGDKQLEEIAQTQRLCEQVVNILN